MQAVVKLGRDRDAHIAGLVLKAGCCEVCALLHSCNPADISIGLSSSYICSHLC